MGYWAYMLIMSLLIPAMMAVFGSVYEKMKPKEVDRLCGYRTSMSTKNRETWEFVHRHFGRIWRVVGLVMLVLSFAAMVFVFGKDARDIGGFSRTVIAVQAIALIVSMIPTEIALRRNFDTDGNRK